MSAKPTKSKSTGKEMIVKPLKSIQIVVFSCGNCGEEIEELKLCPDCKAPMRVVQVIEKYGDDAEAYLRALKGKITEEEIVSDSDVADLDKSEDLSHGIVSSKELDDLDAKDGNTDNLVEGLDEGIDEIFPDDSAGGSSPVTKDKDFEEALKALDEEEEAPSYDGFGGGDDNDELPEL